ncbi:type 4a pilus biogenesis protein PilO [Actinoplanes teichomyceticus]|uniref:Pilus assembly protein PilO n=1 Tax=Actinoplanes teichomyceticus TaxID=1867 RepID=A0A561VGR4_ACTTI|nr:type 4a pilus biogenesis protein PilO [Actinoplanes teichomyceticus]TWG10797.1 pilus assembly protein PilO [Actinoplanes teichomyceticus]GIF12583.1 hypothetical protein Ate01nite_26150 [Actinoplanes teichomyceticus]
MNVRRTDRIWLFGGLAVIALLIAAGWFLLISPKYTEASDVRSQVDDTTAQLATLRRQLSDLKADNANLKKYQDELAKNRKALPDGDDIPALLRQLQNMGTKLDVEVTAYSATGRTQSKAVSTVEELPITLNAVGKVADISRFVKQLQGSQPRAVLIQTANLTIDGREADGYDQTEMALTLVAFRNTATSTTTVATTQ